MTILEILKQKFIGFLLPIYLIMYHIKGEERTNENWTSLTEFSNEHGFTSFKETLKVKDVIYKGQEYEEWSFYLVFENDLEIELSFN